MLIIAVGNKNRDLFRITGTTQFKKESVLGQLKADRKLCSICMLRSIITDVHPSIKNECNLFCALTQASAVPLAQYSTEISSSFIHGQQQDPSEFLVVLLDHMMNCLSSINSLLFSKYMSSPLHSIFGFNVKSSIKCTKCLHEFIQENYESLLPISINSHSNLEDALTAFFSQVELGNENSFDCSKCKQKTTALQSMKLADMSPVLFIQLKRFIYDQSARITRKIRRFVSYPEYLDLMPYVDKHVLQSNQGNHQLDKLIWQLYGVIIHLGDTANDGHVYSHIRSPDGAWYKADDETISPIDLKHVLADNDSYILCYTKLSDERINLSITEINSVSERPTRNVRFSTPIRPHEMIEKTFDNCSPVRKNFF
jgi:ubiquitin carboxyl-terminal hydrolase 36/42